MGDKVDGLRASRIYPWLVVAGVFFLRFGGLGAIVAESAIYFVPIREELGIMPGELSWWITCYAFGMALSMLYVGRLYPKVDSRVLLSGSFLIAISACAAMGLYYEVWQFCVSGFIIGLSGGFIFMVPGPIILSNWFIQRRGLAIGISALGSGVAGMILPLIGVLLIEAYGWRNTEFIMAGIACAIVLPWTLFVIRYDPSQKGLVPYGWKPEHKEMERAKKQEKIPGVPARRAVFTLAFAALFVCAGLASCFGGFRQHFTSMANEWGYTALFAATMLSVSSFAAFLQPVIGWLNDWLKPRKVTMGLSTLVLCSVFGLALFHDNQTVVLICAFVFMLQVPIVGVQVPLMVREIFGAKDYPKVFSYIQIGIGLIGAFAAPTVGYFYDSYGSYSGAFIFGICIALVIMLLVNIAYSNRKDIVWEE